jgi:hypothetical protein
MMNVVLEIAGRDALAVWTLPYITSWRLSPDMLLERLASHGSIFPTAFNLDTHNIPSPLQSAQWDELYNLIQKTEQDLTDMKLSKHDDRAEWLKRSIEEFWRYESCYVWLDEFEKWYYERFIKNTWASENGEDIKLSFNPMLPKEHAQYFKNIELPKLKPKAPLDKLYKEIEDARIIANGAPTLSLQNFIDRLLVEAVGESKPLPSFYDLVEVYGLVVYDKVIDGQVVSSGELLGTLRQREQQADRLFDDDGFRFWETLVEERKYSVFRDDVAMAYYRAGKSLFPWFSWNGVLVWLNVGEPTLGNMKSEAKQEGEPSIENIEDIIAKPIAELLALLRSKQERKRTLVAVADSVDEAMQLLHELYGLEDFKKKLEIELCRVKSASYQFEESRKADISRISVKITEIDKWLDNYQATGKLEDIEPQHREIETPKNISETLEIGEGDAQDESKQTTNRKTMLNSWLREKWNEWGKPNARDFAAKLKPVQNALGSPVKKYHGWRPDVVVEWQPNWGSTSWGIRAFQNKVSDFRKEDKEEAEK